MFPLIRSAFAMADGADGCEFTRRMSCTTESGWSYPRPGTAVSTVGTTAAAELIAVTTAKSRGRRRRTLRGSAVQSSRRRRATFPDAEPRCSADQLAARAGHSRGAAAPAETGAATRRSTEVRLLTGHDFVIVARFGAPPDRGHRRRVMPSSGATPSRSRVPVCPRRAVRALWPGRARRGP
jgi:hypothetical protein